MKKQIIGMIALGCVICALFTACGPKTQDTPTESDPQTPSVSITASGTQTETATQSKDEGHGYTMEELQQVFLEMAKVKDASELRQYVKYCLPQWDFENRWKVDWDKMAGFFENNQVEIKEGPPLRLSDPEEMNSFCQEYKEDLKEYYFFKQVDEVRPLFLSVTSPTEGIQGFAIMMIAQIDDLWYFADYDLIDYRE